MAARQLHREVFFAHNGVGPYACYKCHGMIAFNEAFPVHHIDEDDTNNAPENLVAIHHGCHSSLHQKGAVRSDEARARMSIANRGKVRSPAHRAAIAAAGRVRVWSDETKAKISAAHKGRVVPLERRARIAATLRAKIWTDDERLRMSADAQARVTPTERERLSMIGTLGAAARWKKERTT